MKYLKYFENTIEKLIKSKINFDIIEDIEMLSMGYMDDGWFVNIRVFSDKEIIYSKLSSHETHLNGLPINIGSIMSTVTKELLDKELTYKFMICWPATEEEMMMSHMAEDEDNIEASEEVLENIKKLYPENNIELDIYQEDEE